MSFSLGHVANSIAAVFRHNAQRDMVQPSRQSFSVHTMTKTDFGVGSIPATEETPVGAAACDPLVSPNASTNLCTAMSSLIPHWTGFSVTNDQEESLVHRIENAMNHDTSSPQTPRTLLGHPHWPRVCWVNDAVLSRLTLAVLRFDKRRVRKIDFEMTARNCR